MVWPVRFTRVFSTRICHGARFAGVLSYNIGPGTRFTCFARLVIAIFVRFYRTIYAMVLVLLEPARGWRLLASFGSSPLVARGMARTFSSCFIVQNML